MTKRIIALLLALILTVGLLPTVALADEGGETPATDPHPTKVEYENEDSPIHITKEVTDKDGQKYLTMEAYVTSPVEIKQKAVPLDIVLVLDVSGSMDDPFGQTNTYEIYTENYYQSLTNDFYAEQNNLYYKVGDKYYPVTIDVTPNYTKLSNAPTYINAYYGDYYVKKATETEYKSLHFEGEYSGRNYVYYMYVGENKIKLVNNWYDQIDLQDYEFFTQDYSNATYTYKYATAENTYTKICESTGANTPLTYEFYRKGTGSVRKMKALQDAANNFIGSVLDNSTNLPANTAHRISIVKFAGKEKTQIGDDTYRDGIYTYNYSQTVVGLTPVTSDNAETLKTTVNKLHAAGATAADYGMKRAKAVLDAREGDGAKRPAVVVMFTDGEPNHDNGFSGQVARDTIKVASELKKNKTTIYTIAVAKNADPDATIGNNLDMNKYMHAVSSNYPNATVNKKQLEMGERVASTKNYYYKATDAEGLKNVFQTISDEISNLPLVVDEETILYDTLTEHFDFAGVSSTDTSKVEVKVVPVKTGTLTGALEWDTANASDLEKPSVTVSGKSIEVKNFDYADNAVKILTNKDGTKTVQSGAKLVIKFPIKVDTTCTNWDKDKEYYETNTANAGLKNYATVKEPDKRTQSTELPDSPELPVGVYTVSYAYTTNSEYTGTALPTGGIYINGQKHDVAPGLAEVTGYRFEGWYTDEACTVSADDEVVINGKNVILYGRYVENTTIVNLTQYIEKNLTATSLPSGYSESFKAEITGSPLTTAAEIKTDDFNAAGTKNFKGAVEVELTYGQNYTFKIKEVKPTTDATEGMTYDETEYTLTVKVSDTGEVTTESSNGTGATKVTITNEYKPGSTGFSLNGKFQKTLNSNTADVPAAGKEFELSITGTAPTTNNTALTGNVTVAPTGSGTTFSDTKAFTFKSGTTGVTALTFTAPGEYKYEVKEVKPTAPVAGMKYDETIYTLTIEVTESNGALSITSAKVTKPGAADQPELVADLLATTHDSFTITNTFTAAELPLDPPTDPAHGTAKIVKNLKSDDTEKSFDFKASITETTIPSHNILPAYGEAKDVKNNDSSAQKAPFSGFGTLVFNTTGEYTFTIKEIEPTDKVPGMTYDKTEHTMVVSVVPIDNKLAVKTVTIDGTEINPADDAWLTITNEYKTPSTGTVTKKTIRSNMYSEIDSDVWNDLLADKGAYIPASDTIVVDKNTNEVTLAYEVSIVGEATATAEVEDDGAEYVTYDSTVDGVTVNYNETTKIATVTFAKAATAKLYYVKTFTRENGEFATAKNVVTVNDGEPVSSDETTITDKDPGSFDFSGIIRKELKLTGSKSFTGAEFEATLTLKDFKQGVPFNSMLTTYAAKNVEAWPEGWSRTLVAKFDTTAVDGSTTNFLTTDGNHLFLDFPAAGTYTFELQETNKTCTNVTYDDTVYTIEVVVTTDKENSNKLVVTDIEATYVNKDGNDAITIYVRKEATGYVMTFVNTVDTGKDDYYPIIIPTIINKDTGMLNKTDHFAYVIGYPDGSVHPNGQITRAEVATIFFRLLRDEVRDGAFTTSNSYSDVAYGKWYNNPISTMSALGIITGYPDGTFKPNKPITRAEFAAIAARFDETQSGKSATFSDVIGHWAAKEIGIAYYNDWIKGYPDGTFKPDQNITRAEAMTLINRVLERKPESPADLLTNMNKWTDNMDTSKWYYLDVQEATNSHGYTRKTFNYELWRQMLPDPDWSRYER